MRSYGTQPLLERREELAICTSDKKRSLRCSCERDYRRRRRRSRHRLGVTHRQWKIAGQTTQGQNALRTLCHRAMCPGLLVGVQGGHGIALQPFRVGLVNGTHERNELLLGFYVARINRTGHRKVPLGLGVTPVNGNTAGGLGVEKLLSDVSGAGIVLIGQAELIVLQKLMLQELATTPPRTRGQGRPYSILVAACRIYGLVLIQPLKGGIADGVSRIRDNKGTELGLAPQIRSRNGRTAFYRNRLRISNAIQIRPEPVNL